MTALPITSSRLASDAMELVWPLIDLALAVFVLVWGAACILAALLLRVVAGGPRLSLAMARRVWAPPHFVLGRVRIEVLGRDRVDFEKASLFAANHQSILDIPALFMALPQNVRFVARRSLRSVPFLGWYMTAMGMVFVDRSRASHVARAIEEATRLLVNGFSVVTFPEATRTRDGAIGRFKGGALVPAIEAGAPVVPISIGGAYELLPSGGFRVRPGCIRVTFGQPLETAGLTARDRHGLAAQVRSRVLELQGGPGRATATS